MVFLSSVQTAPCAAISDRALTTSQLATELEEAPAGSL